MPLGHISFTNQAIMSSQNNIAMWTRLLTLLNPLGVSHMDMWTNHIKMWTIGVKSHDDVN